MKKEKNAILSVYDKRGIVDLAQILHRHGWTLYSTGGTARVLHSAGLEVIEISRVTEFPEIMNGRVKTLHPRIFAGILARRGHEGDQKDLENLGLLPFDLVVVNLYPFRQKYHEIEDFRQLMEYIDIGGPSMVRAAAKNWPDVTVLVDPDDYLSLMRFLDEGGWPLPESFRLAMAGKAFCHTAVYDAMIASAFRGQASLGDYPEVMPLVLEHPRVLRYGENPHQSAAWYQLAEDATPWLHNAQILQGKELSYNNILDLDAVVRLVGEFEDDRDHVTAVVVKHNTPSGVARGKVPSDAYKQARDADALSAFGGVAAVGTKVDRATAEAVVETFMECLIAPAYEPDALEVLAVKRNLRVLALPFPWRARRRHEMRTILGGVLIQECDLIKEDPQSWKIVSRRQPSAMEMDALTFAWTVVKHAKSNAVILADNQRTLGIGAGQVSRVDSVKIAIEKAGKSAVGAVSASDAFFPFRDSIDALGKAGVTAVIHPGGSIRDQEVIQAADEYDMTMVFTGVRHFRH